jgi:hypothetical protein
MPTPRDHTKRNGRRDPRLPYRAAFRLLWDQDSFQPKCAKAFSSEVSERGLSLEASQPIPVGTRLSLRAESGTLFGGAIVKHVTRRGASYALGVQLNYHLLDEALAFVREVYSTPPAKQQLL